MVDADDNTLHLREELAKTRIAPDLLIQVRSNLSLPQPLRVIVEFNALFPGGEAAARTLLLLHLLGLTATFDFADILRPSWIAVSPLLKGMNLTEGAPAIEKTRLELFNSLLTEKYLFGELTSAEIRALASTSANVPNLDEPIALIHKIWSDQKVERQVYRSASTIKCDAARAAFNSAGQEIVWGVADTGVSRHKHFSTCTAISCFRAGCATGTSRRTMPIRMRRKRRRFAIPTGTARTWPGSLRAPP